MYRCTHTRTRAHACIRKYTHTHAHSHMHAHTYTHSHTHTRLLSPVTSCSIPHVQTVQLYWHTHWGMTYVKICYNYAHPNLRRPATDITTNSSYEQLHSPWLCAGCTKYTQFAKYFPKTPPITVWTTSEDQTVPPAAWEMQRNMKNLMRSVFMLQWLCYVMLCYVMLCYVMLCYVVIAFTIINFISIRLQHHSFVSSAEITRLTWNFECSLVMLKIILLCRCIDLDIKVFGTFQYSRNYFPITITLGLTKLQAEQQSTK
jgi:hypothetical protein